MPEVWDRLLGAISQNSWGVELPSAAREYFGLLEGVAESDTGKELTLQAYSLEAAAAVVAVEAEAEAMQEAALADEEEEELDEESDEEEEADQTMAAPATIAARFGAAVEALPDTEGSAIFLELAMINHSCAPNAAVEFLGADAEATLLALRPIAAGEEILVTYVPIDAEDALAERRSMLHEYAFDCKCTRCAAELE